MDRSAFYKSYFVDCSSITHLDDSQLFYETKIPKVVKASKQPSSDFAKQTCLFAEMKSTAKPVTFNGVKAV